MQLRGQKWREGKKTSAFTLQNNDVIQELEATSKFESEMKDGHQPVEKELVEEAPKETKVVLKNEKIDKKSKVKEKCCWWVISINSAYINLYNYCDVRALKNAGVNWKENGEFIQFQNRIGEEGKDILIWS